MGWLGVPVIVPYMGFSNGREVFINGSVMEDKGLHKPHENQSLATNMLSMLKRYASDEIGGARVEVTFRNHKQHVETNELGIFQYQFSLTNGEISELHFETAHFRLLDRIVEEQPQTEATGKVVMVPELTALGVISDIDDTVMVSHATNALKKLRLMLFRNAHTRVPFEGVAAFYRALQKGRQAKESSNPLFYVSSSEWNLYDLLKDFFAYHTIPEGPLLLQELQHSIYKFWKSGGGTHMHKLQKIGRLFTFFNKLSFILIGDSGQRDPEIYLEAVKKYPNRIKAVYIRSVDKGRKKKKHMEIAKTMAELGVPMLLINDTAEAARHAVKQGFIDAASVPMIEKEAIEDERLVNG
jgi:phosphatidate phosphatase APP1